MKTFYLKSILLGVLFYFNLSPDCFSQTIDRGAYLQNGHQTGITIRWRTTTNTNSRVRIGTTYDATGNYPTIINDAASVTQHIVNVTGLTADTKYYYSIGTSTTPLQMSANNFFTTAPPPTTTRKIKIVAFGDCGAETNNTNQTASYNAYQTFLTNNGIDAPDALLLLGDNAYNVGSETEYTTKFFTPYGGGTKNILRNHKLFPTPGNHDYNNSQALASRRLRTWPYFTNFTFPQNGECGGVASTKPNYYSYNIGNIHFLALDSHGQEQTDGDSYMGTNSATTVMKNWITADLAANTQKWVVAYWHHPPYTKGSHNSDTETQLIEIRQNFVTFLEGKGVDLVIAGHSHAYERSYLMKGFTGNWTTFSAPTHAVSTSSAKYDGTVGAAPYKYNSLPLNHGAVYVVAANTGAMNSSTTNFGAYAMPWAVATPGVFYFEVEDNKLSAKMIRSTGAIFDSFTVMKDVNKTTVQNIILGQSATLTASWPANAGTYVWTNTVGTNRANIVTPGTVGSFNYTVADNRNGGLLDNFTVNVTGTLPVTFKDFKLQKNAAGININWTVSTIINHSYFSIERSTDGIRFTEINRNSENINGLTEKSFSVNDINLPAGNIFYYRIKQCDVNGACKYTDVKSVRFDKYAKPVLYPKPAENVLNILYTGNGAIKIDIIITDEIGRVLIKETKTVSAGRNNLQTDISKLKPGTYIVIINDGTEKWTENLIKL